MKEKISKKFIFYNILGLLPDKFYYAEKIYTGSDTLMIH